MKFKVGDKVIAKYDDGHEGTIVHVDSLANYPYLVKIDTGYFAGLKFYLQEDHLELVKTDLRDLLKVGYKYTTTDYQYLVGNLDVLHAKERRDENLKGLGICKEIIAIHKPKYNGIKPMEWELVWEREEKLFTLKLPGNVRDKYYGAGNTDTKYSYNFEKNIKVNSMYKYVLTQQEINELPHQEFIKTLVKEEVK